VTRTDNATVDIGPLSGQSGDCTVPLQGQAQATLFVNRVIAGQASTATFVVTDGCGDWPTFVVGGPTAF